MSISKFIKKVCVQDAVYWPPGMITGYGQREFEEPRLIKCRWVDTTKTITDKNGQIIVCDAEILVVDDLEVGGFIYLGDFTGLTNENRVDPKTLPGAYEIRRVDKVPLFRSKTEFVKKVYV